MEEEFGPAPSKQMKEEGMKRGISPRALQGYPPSHHEWWGHFTQKTVQPSPDPVVQGWPGNWLLTQEVHSLPLPLQPCPFKHLKQTFILSGHWFFPLPREKSNEGTDQPAVRSEVRKKLLLHKRQ